MLSIVLGIFFFLLFIGAPIAYTMGITSVIYIIMHPSVSGMVVAQKVYTSLDSFSLMAIPFFMFAGDIMNESGITEKLVRFSSALVGHIRGGLPQTVVLTGTLMAGISGSGNADATAIGGMMLPMLKEEGYEEGFAVSVVAAAAALGPIIPPSIIMVIYANVTNLPIGRMFLGGIVPGILIALFYMIYINHYCKKHGHEATKSRASLKEIIHTTISAFWALLMPIIIVGGILSGVFTATEAGVIASFYGLCYGIVNKTLKWEVIRKSLTSCMHATAVPVFIIGMATMFSWVLTVENMPKLLVGYLTSITSNGHMVMILLVLLVTIMGMFIDAVPIMYLTVPIFLPIVMQLGVPEVHFMVLTITLMMIGQVTPPFGVVLFAMNANFNTKLEVVIKGSIPFLIVMTVCAIIIIFIPQISTFLPSLLLGR